MGSQQRWPSAHGPGLVPGPRQPLPAELAPWACVLRPEYTGTRNARIFSRAGRDIHPGLPDGLFPEPRALSQAAPPPPRREALSPAPGLWSPQKDVQPEQPGWVLSSLRKGRMGWGVERRPWLQTCVERLTVPSPAVGLPCRCLSFPSVSRENRAPSSQTSSEEERSAVD